MRAGEELLRHVTSLVEGAGAALEAGSTSTAITLLEESASAMAFADPAWRPDDPAAQVVAHALAARLTHLSRDLGVRRRAILAEVRASEAAGIATEPLLDRRG